MTNFGLSQWIRIAEKINAQEFDHPFMLNPDGTVTDAPSNIYAPEATDGFYSHDHPQDVTIWTSDWKCATYGMSGQHGYRGGVMHPSEYIGGAIARRLLSDEPTIYVITEVRDENGTFPDGDPIGWTILRYTSRTA